MKTNDLVQIIVYFGSLVLLVPVLGTYLAQVFDGRRHWFTPAFNRLEQWLYRLAGIDPSVETNWKQYAVTLLLFNAWGFAALLSLQLCQGLLPLNPQHMPKLPFWLAFNTAVSFMTNTNWQAYSGEAVMSYLTQMLGLTVQNFLSAGTGMSVLLAFSRGFIRVNTDKIGNFYSDLVKTILYILLPLSCLFALVLVGQGVVQSFHLYHAMTTLEGQNDLIPLGPAASQIAIKQLGTNGGGFFGVNCAHPFENPTPFSNYLEMLALLLIPASSVYMFGLMVKNRRHGWCLFGVMLVILIAGFAAAWWAETHLNPVTGLSGWMEGKETRFGVMNSVLWGTATTAASNGSVNAMHDSFSPLAGLILLVNMMLGEIIFGGVGSGLYGMLLFVLLTVFLAGLMVGRTPEYLGKKIEAREMVWVIMGILISGAVIVTGTALACLLPSTKASLANGGPHGFSEVLYAFASAGANNGSAFAGLNADTFFFNIALAVAMLLGRFGVILPVLALSSALGLKKITPPNSGTFPTNGVTFMVVLGGVILIVGALTFFPVLLLGPVADHFLMMSGRTF